MSNIIPMAREAQSPVAVPDSVIEEYLVSFGNKLKDTHRRQFIQICKAFQLNPFIREIYGIQYGENFNIIVGYEVYLKRAERSGILTGWKAWTEGEGDDMRGCIEIHRRDWTQPFYHEVYFSEYDQKNTMWKTKARTMIKKVAIAQAFRMAFPEELGGMPYTSDEIVVQGETVNVATGEITQPQGKPSVQQPQTKAAPATDNGDKATEGQVKMLHVKLKQGGVSEASFKAHYKINSVSDLPKSLVNDAIKAIGAGEIKSAEAATTAEPEKAAEPETEVTLIQCKNCGEMVDPVKNTGHMLDCPYAGN